MIIDDDAQAGNTRDHSPPERRGPGWDGWLRGSRPEPAPLLVRSDERAWIDGARSQFSYRDLGLGRATSGAIGARHVRRIGGGVIGFDWHCHDADFQFNYVIRGSATVESEHGRRYMLAPGDAVSEPGLHRVRELDFSEDYECIQISVPAEPAPPIAGRDAVLPPRAASLDPARATGYCPGAAAAGARDAGTPVWWRDLGASAMCGGRLELRLACGETTGSHATSANWVCVLAGNAEISRPSGGERVSLGPYDAVCLPPGGAEVAVVAPGYRALELVLAAFTTTRGRQHHGVR